LYRTFFSAREVLGSCSEEQALERPYSQIVSTNFAREVYSVWEHPDVFGAAVCMSSTFSHKDHLIDRVLTEQPRDVGFYLDTGWSGDNYEVTVGMAMALVSRGWRYGHNLFHLAFPMAEHNEAAWGMRLHLPLQF
jgi:hypothetical protein